MTIKVKNKLLLGNLGLATDLTHPDAYLAAVKHRLGKYSP